MYRATFIIDNHKFHGTLDMYAIKKAQDELEECGKKLKIHEIFKGIADLDMHCITAVILQSVLRASNISESDFLELYLRDRSIEETEKNINYSLEFISELLKKCMPKNEVENEDDDFEDIPDFNEEEKSDWDFPYMEYMWTTELKKNNFWEVTPKNYFEQIEIYKKFNSKEDSEDIEYL